MNGFVASDGTPVHIHEENGSVRLFTSMPDGTYPMPVAAGDVQALREFFRAEEDERLGRWRWPEEPDYVVYPSGVAVRVLYEATGADTYPLYRDSIPGSRPARAALAYFAAHPEPEPWHDAKPGDHWALHIPSGATMPDEFHLFKVTRWMDRDGWFFVPTEGGSVFALNDSAITAGRRVWPEVAS